MLDVTIKLISVVFIYKIISIGPFTASASTLVMPFWFLMGDIIAEVYGYKIARHVIWMAIICQFVFAIACAILINLHSPVGWPNQDAYNQVLGKIIRVAFASSLAIVCGSFINVYAVSKWKILLKGKYFWLRSLGASAVGEFTFTLVACLSEFLGVVPASKLIHLMAVNYFIKLAINPFLVIPSVIAASVLKKIEGVDVYDYITNFNPFRMGMYETQNNEFANDVPSVHSFNQKNEAI